MIKKEASAGRESMNGNKTPMGRLEAKMTVITWTVILGGLSLLLLVLPKKDFSEWERRYLAERPKVSLETLKNGTFAEDSESWLSDHMPFRDRFVSFYSAYEQALGKREIGGVYLGRDGYLIQKLTDGETDEAFLKSVPKLFSDFGDYLTEQGVSYRVTVVPSSGLMLSDKLPKGAPYYDQAAFLDGFRESLGDMFLDLRSVLKDSSDYYRNDHHWTTEGAYKAYALWVQSLGRTPVPLTEFHRVTVSDRFLGTYYAKAKPFMPKPDTVTAYEPLFAVMDYDSGKSDADSALSDRGNTAVVAVTADGKMLPGLFERSKKDSVYDTYSYFLGGNYAELMITGNGPAERKLLVIKDSFANCFLPFTVTEWGIISVLDLRYFGGSVREYVTANGITDVLILYGADGLTGEKSVRKLGR